MFASGFFRGNGGGSENGNGDEGGPIPFAVEKRGTGTGTERKIEATKIGMRRKKRTKRPAEKGKNKEISSHVEAFSPRKQSEK